jgi:flavorubredoxin
VVFVTTDHAGRVRQELIAAGISKTGLRSFGSRYLPQIVHQDEHIGGVVYGRQTNDSALLIATNQRILFLDKKPLFVDENEVSYDVVSGISFSHAGFGSTVTLHTRIEDFTLHTLNQKAARIFMEYVESQTQIHKQRRDLF